MKELALAEEVGIRKGMKEGYHPKPRNANIGRRKDININDDN